MRSLRRHLGKLVAGALLLALAGLLLLRHLRGAELRGVPVTRAEVVQTVLVSGRVLPPAQIELTSRVEASVLEVPVREGDHVDPGAVLARLDATGAEAEVARARAALARAQAASGRSRVGPQLAEQTLSSAQVQSAEARRALEQAQALVASGAWPRDRLEAARDALTRASAAERAAELELGATRGADRRAASAAVDEAVALLAVAEEQLAHSTISAPVGVVVLERRVEVGDTVRPGTALFLVAADGPPILSVDPDERHLAQLALAQPARARSDAYAERPFDAQVSFIAPAIDPERGTVEVRLLPTGAIDFLRPYMTVSVEIEVARAASALVVPAELVRDAASAAPFVWVAEAGRLARRPVTLGLRGDEAAQVVDGLEEGDVVLEVVSAALAPGDRVRVAR